MNDVSQTANPPVDADRFGDGFAAGCRLLRSRYQLLDETAFLIVAAATATAIGPTVRVRDPLGGDLPPSLNLTFCATSRSPISAALSDAFRVFREAVGQKAVGRENVGSRRLRTDFLATLTALGAVEQQLRHAAPLPPPPAYAPFPTPDQDDTLRRTKLERENRLAHRDVLRTELGEPRMDLAPYLVVEDPGWDTVLALDKLAFDNCLTSVSPDGSAFQKLLASTPKRIGKIARLLQASRVRSRRVMVQVSPASGSMHYGKSTSRQRPHDAAPSSRVPSVARKYPRPGRQAWAKPKNGRQVAQAYHHGRRADRAAPAP